ncbi:hypothetical protein CMV30_17340 [Nibricoccus aquaticus]|uniref:Uncharacterized protein n=1 Tax=Nibricoccus aquaticus TaxID=2576891 RepID=A0A290QM03_9BACT|nr:hypothetical protein [Nibricoccus aquaticus]ATC65571.1 hypothetical protein CMV30_17340 [Nibricoccus aquaticus]
MRLKIKWNDDRVRGAATALLLIGRDLLSRGITEDLVATALTLYRDDPDGYKLSKAAWADVREPGPLTKPQHVAYYKNLLLAVDALLVKTAQAKREFNSFTDLDNYLITALKGVR